VHERLYTRTEIINAKYIFIEPDRLDLRGLF
jgi:hypothetical protein